MQWKCPRTISSLDDIIISEFESTNYIFDQSNWNCNGLFDLWFANITNVLCIF